MTVIKLTVSGTEHTRAAFERLGRESPARLRRAQNRTAGVARERAIKSTAKATGVPQRVLRGRQTRKSKAGLVKGTGYFKLLKATRTRGFAAVVVLVEGVRFSALKRQSLGRARRKPGGQGEPFRATMRSGHSSLFERRAPLTRVSRGNTEKTRRPNLPIREVVIPIYDAAERATKILMRRAARSVLPAKLWEELRKSIKPVR